MLHRYNTQSFRPRSDFVRAIGEAAVLLDDWTPAKEWVHTVAVLLDATPQELEAFTRKGSNQFYSNVLWAKQNLKEFGFVQCRRGEWRFTAEGKYALPISDCTAEHIASREYLKYFFTRRVPSPKVEKEADFVSAFYPDLAA